MEVRAEHWTKQHFKVKVLPGDPYLTRATANYPKLMNRFLAKRLVNSALSYRIKRTKAIVGGSMRRVGEFGNSLVNRRTLCGEAASPQQFESAEQIDKRIDFTVPLRGKDRIVRRTTEIEADKVIGGMRHPWKAPHSNPKLSWVGLAIRKLFIDIFIKNPGISKRCTDGFGSENEDVGPTEADLLIGREALGQYLQVSDLEAVNNETVDSPVRAGLLEGWQQKSGDPDDQPTRWLREGAPAGLACRIEPRGIFPLLSDEELGHEVNSDLGDLVNDPDDLDNYPGIEEDEDVAEEVEGLRKAGVVVDFSDLEEVKKFVGGEPVVSKVGCVKKQQGNKIKKRIILDCKRSKVAPATRRPERCVLPRVRDPIHAALAMMAAAFVFATLGLDHFVEWAVLDVTAAFYLLGLHKLERRFFVFRFRGKFYVYVKQAMGAGASPLCWGRLIALIARLTAGMYNEKEFQMEVFVDDPIATVCGTRLQIDTNVALWVYAWRVLGVPLAFKKGQRGANVTWIGATMTLHSDRIVATIRDEIVNNLRTQVDDVRGGGNVVPQKDVRSLAGRGNHIASLIHTWRPFLQTLWAAMYGKSESAPAGCIWRKQIDMAVNWLACFLAGLAGSLTREFFLMAYMNWGQPVCLLLDASPWGLGAALREGDNYIEWFTSPVDELDVSHLGLPIGSPDGQQVWESLCALVALRHWHSRWHKGRVRIEVRGDSVCMLTLVIQLRARASSPALGMVAREMALDIAEAVYTPDVVSHVPGLAHKVADGLSRRFETKKAAVWQLPALLAGVPEAHVARRDEKFWRCARPPPVRSGSAKPSGLG